MNTQICCKCKLVANQQNRMVAMEKSISASGFGHQEPAETLKCPPKLDFRASSNRAAVFFMAFLPQFGKRPANPS
jgi:hypothetical protein